MKNRQTTWLWTAVLMMAAATATRAQVPAGPTTQGPEGREREPWSLDLTEEQRAQLGDIRTQLERESIDLRASLAKERLALRELLAKETPDEQAIGRQIDTAHSAQARLAKARVAARLKTARILTPEQRRQMRSLRQRFHQRGFQGRGFGRPPEDFF